MSAAESLSFLRPGASCVTNVTSRGKGSTGGRAMEVAGGARVETMSGARGVEGTSCSSLPIIALSGADDDSG